MGWRSFPVRTANGAFAQKRTWPSVASSLKRRTSSRVRSNSHSKPRASKASLRFSMTTYASADLII